MLLIQIYYWSLTLKEFSHVLFLAGGAFLQLTRNCFLKIKSLHPPFDPFENMLLQSWLIHMWESSTTKALISLYFVQPQNKRAGRRGMTEGFNYNTLSCEALIYIYSSVPIGIDNEMYLGKQVNKYISALQTITWENSSANKDILVLTLLKPFLFNQAFSTNIFCEPWSPRGGVQHKGSSFQSESQAHHSSPGPQLSIQPWSGKPALSDPSGLPGGWAVEVVEHPSQAKP